MTHEGFTAVARSWEERFGAVVTSVYPAGLGFAVANPPRAEEQAVILAAEQTAFAPEEGLIGAPEELPALARQLRTGVPAAGGSRSRHYWLFGWPD